MCIRDRPEFRGGYTYPSPGCLPLRAALRAPVDRLLFCGEHCTAGLDPCVQAALADGERAAALALDRLAVAEPPPPPREIVAPGRAPARPSQDELPAFYH